MGVRLILVNDHYDSLSPNHDFITIRMKSFINDIYPADTSRSVRANLLAKMMDGQCVAAFAFYGYLKSQEDKHKLVADPVAGAVVQDIFHLKLKGYSLSAIAKVLNARGILPPLAYKQIFLKQKLTVGFKTNGKNLWDASMIISKKALLRMKKDSAFRQKVYKSIADMPWSGKLTGGLVKSHGVFIHEDGTGGYYMDALMLIGTS